MTASATNALIAYFNGTFVNIENGAHARMADQLRWAMGNFPQVILYSFSDHPACPWRAADIARFHKDYPGVELVLDRRSARLERATRIKNAALTLAPDHLASVLSWHVRGATPGYDALLARGARNFLINYVDALAQLNGVEPSRCVLETHDIKFLQYAHKAHRSLADLRVMGKLRSEAWVLGAVGGIIAIAPPEAAMFKLWYPHRPVFYVPAYPAPVDELSSGNGNAVYDLLFVGSENHFNVEGITAFLERNASWLSAYRIAIAGRVCGVEKVAGIAARFGNITLAGYVSDLRPLYAKSKAVLSPVEGTGLKIKVVEALREGKPVFASEHSANGLPPGAEHCVFSLAPQDIAAVLNDPAAYQEACLAARNYSRSISGFGEAAKLRDHIMRGFAAKAAEGSIAEAGAGALLTASS